MSRKEKTRSLFDSMEQQDLPAGRVIRVAFDTGADDEFDYLLPQALPAVAEGQRVEVPLGKNNKPVIGFVVKVLMDADEIEKSRRFRLKTVRKVLDAVPLLDNQLLTLAGWIAEYYVCPLGQVLAAMIPAAVKKDAGVKIQEFIFLNPEKIGESPPVKSSKQRSILDYLGTLEIYDKSKAIEKKSLLRQLSCTPVPLKGLLLKELVQVVSRRVVWTLPAIPKGLLLEKKEVVLNPEQQKVIEHVTSRLHSGGFGVTLLFGVTDSGKTEVYIRAIEACIQRCRQAIVMLPEIALTTQTVERFQSRFKNLAVMHSALTGPQRNAQWQMIKEGRADVVIGRVQRSLPPSSGWV